MPRFHEAVRQAKKDLILRAIEQSDGNYAAAAKLLGLQTNYLHRLMMSLQIRPAPRTGS